MYDDEGEPRFWSFMWHFAVSCAVAAVVASAIVSTYRLGQIVEQLQRIADGL